MMPRSTRPATTSSARSTSSPLRTIGRSSSSAPASIAASTSRGVRSPSGLIRQTMRALVAARMRRRSSTVSVVYLRVRPALSRMLPVPLPVDDDGVDPGRHRSCRKPDIVSEEEELETGCLPNVHDATLRTRSGGFQPDRTRATATRNETSDRQSRNAGTTGRRVLGRGRNRQRCSENHEQGRGREHDGRGHAWRTPDADTQRSPATSQTAGRGNQRDARLSHDPSSPLAALVREASEQLVHSAVHAVEVGARQPGRRRESGARSATSTPRGSAHRASR